MSLSKNCVQCSLWSAVVLALLCSVPVLAQQSTIQGIIQDASGAAIPGATVTVTNTATGVGQTTTATAEGLYSVPFLIPGNYSIKAEAKGFAAKTMANLTLDVGATARADVVLGLGKVETTIEVSATAALLDSETSIVGQVIDNQRVVELPLDGRNYLELALLTPGAAPADGSRSAGVGAFTAAGSKAYQMNILLDGVDNASRISGGQLGYEAQAVTPSIDAVQEFKVVTNNNSAEFGFRMGGTVMVQTKSGTNNFHGSMYEFLRNDKFSANNFFANRAGSDKTVYKRNQYGGTFGGRIIRDKTFFFGSYEGSRIHTGEVDTSSVPLASMKKGDFNLPGLQPIFDPASTQQIAGKWTRNPFPGNIIPVSQFDPVGAKVAAWYPDPTMPGLTRNFFFSPINVQNTDQLDARLDHNLNSSNRGSIRYSRRYYRGTNPGGLPLPADGGMWTTIDLVATSYVGNWNAVLSPVMNNEFRFGFTRSDSVMDIPWTQNNKDLGMQSLNDFGKDNDHGVTRFSPTGYTDLGSRSFWPNTNVQNVYHISNQLNRVHGKHLLKIGVEFRTELVYRRASRFARGLMNFNASFSQDPNNRGKTGDALADVILGFASGGTYSNIQGEQGKTRNYAAFFQDDIRLLPKLTLNLGVRWDRFGMESYGDLSKLPVSLFVLPPAGTSGYQIIRPKDASDCGCEHANKNFAPRVGLAYQLKPSTVIRTGFGVYYGVPGGVDQNSIWHSGPPDYSEFGFTTDRLVQPALVVSQGFPTNLFPVTTVAQNLAIDTEWSRYRPTQYSMQWFFDIQQQLPLGTVVTASYIGNGSRQMLWNRNLNAVGPGVATIKSRQPWPFFDTISTDQPGGMSSYNALGVKGQKRFSKGLTFLASYTYSHMIDDGAGTLGDANGGWRNPNNISMDRASSNYDRRHIFVSSFVYDLPIGRGKKLGTNWNRVVNSILGGWQLGGITTFRTGRLFDVTVSGNPENASGTNYADRIGNGALPASQRSIDGWVDKTAFLVPVKYVYGNGGRNILTGPGQTNTDLKIGKNFRAFEKYRIEFRTEMFNFTNTPNFGLPNGTLQNVNFGKISSAAAPRVIQFGMKLTY